MILKPDSTKIAITIDLSRDYLSNGVQQNLIFLADCINQITDKECFFLYIGKLDNKNYILNYSCISYEVYLKEKINNFDVVIYAGFLPPPDVHAFDRSRYALTKFVYLQLGNELNEDIDSILHPSEKRNAETFLANMYEFDQIWTSPHYKKSIPYLATKHHNYDVKISPYLWNDTFIKIQFDNLKLNISFDIFKSNLNYKKVSVFEPNLFYTKTCLIPIYIVENYIRNYDSKIESLDIFGAQNLVKNEYFMKLILSMDSYNKKNEFLKIYPRMNFLRAVKNHGGLIISHQIYNELNYLYFESLYLSLPLIHNSNMLKDYGYFYNEYDINKASEHIDQILKNHKKNIAKQKLKNEKLFREYSPYSQKNIILYKTLIDLLIQKQR